MALWAHHLTVEPSLFYCAPFTTWAAQTRLNEALRGLGPSRGPSRAERRGASGASSPRPREGPGAEARPGRGPLKGRGFSALRMQRTTSPQATKKFTRKFLQGFLQFSKGRQIENSLTWRYRNLYL